ncbi:MAG: DNA polymerase III subunit beta [Blastopirellula sp.]|nr:MAG: DNA polymerase III subunit beta [Blastopirellula sp.]
MTNEQIAERFGQLADLLEFQGANAFRIRAYRGAVRIIGGLTEQITTILKDETRKLTDIEGIGKEIAAKSVVLVETGRLPQLDALLEEIPKTVLQMLKIPGLGAKKAAVIYRELGIADLESLQLACEQNQIQALKGFGKKSEETILSGIALAAEAGKRIRWVKADQVVQQLLEHLGSCTSIQKMEAAGSYRRGKETIGDIDILTVSEDANEVMDRLEQFPETESVIVRGDTKISIRLESGLQIDLRVVPAESFGAALQYFTGSKEHNVKIRGIAKTKGLKINEYGVYRVEDGGDETYIAGASEAEVYQTLELPWFPPELREDRVEFAWAEQDPQPELLSQEQLIGDLHMHTTATDGKHTLEEMIEAAIQVGYQYIAITDHSKRVSMAHGLNAERLLAQWEEIDTWNNNSSGQITVLKGIECDILEQGGMDLEDEVLAQADWVIASVHYGQNQSREQITDRIIGALENRHVSIIAHPTGRLVNKRKPYEVDMDAVFQAAKANNKMMELNANPARLDLNEIHCIAAKQHGIPIVISTDAHSTNGFEVMRHGVQQARRAGLTRDDVANTLPWMEIQKLLGRV